MKRSIYDIQSDYVVLQDLLFEAGGDITDPLVSEYVDKLFDELEGEAEKKAEGYCWLIREFEQHEKANSEEAKRFADKAKVCANSVKSLKERLKIAMQSMNMLEIKSKSFTVKVTRNGGNIPLQIDDGEIPQDYVVVREERLPNRDLIRKCLEAGDELSFARLQEPGTHLRIR